MLLFIDGFEHYASADIVEKYTSSGGSLSSAQARTGSQSFTGGSVNLALPASGTTIIFGCGLRPSTSFGDNLLFTNGGFGSTSYWQVCVHVGSDGTVFVRRGDASATIIAQSAAGVVRAGIWQHIEAKIVLDQSAGTVLVKVNGATVINASGLDTCYSATAAWTGVVIAAATNSYLDDLYICDGSGSQNNDLLGECRVVTLLPSDGNGSNTDFTCSSASDHGALVNEAAPNDDTDYVYSSTLNHVDSWNYPALGYTGTIKGVQMSLSAKKTDSGTRAVAAVTRPASTNRVHATDHYLGTNYAYWRAIWELNPEDSAAWEVADVDGAEFGVKVTV